MPDLAVWPTDGADGSVSSEARWRKMARSWVPSGVISGLVPTLAAGPTINVAVGQVWLDGHFAELTTPASVPATANGLLVVRFTPADNHAELLYRDAATLPTQTDPTWELPVARMIAGGLADARPVLPAGMSAAGGVEVANVSNPGRISTTGGTTEAAPLTVCTASLYFDGLTAYEVLFTCFSCVLTAPAGAGAFLGLSLWLDNADQGRIGIFNTTLASTIGMPVSLRRRINPPIGVHALAVRAWQLNATSGYVDTGGMMSIRRL